MDEIREKALKIMEITNGNICDRCLGRIFYAAIQGTDNRERGNLLQKHLNMEVNENKVKDSEMGDAPINRPQSCYVCENIFKLVEEDLPNQIMKKISDSGVEFSTFLMGCRVPDKIIQKEKKLHEEVNVEGESIKKEINRELGKKLSLMMDKEVDFDNPNLVVVMDFNSNSIELQRNPLFIKSRYQKLIRGIPQTKWPCRKCKGRGCERCNYTGKMYPESVEELISNVVLKASQGQESKFHGAGREDIDVRMLGQGRPFVLEIKEPKIRSLNLEELKHEINSINKGKVEVADLKFVGKNRKREIKSSSTETYKIYRALVELDDQVSDDDLGVLNSLKVINQRTPIRVSHRRADKIRTREVKELSAKKLDGKHLELVINCEGGLYIKELISGDEGRTKPSVSSLMGVPARCVQLDVMEVNI